MTTTKLMELPTINPEYLIAKIDADKARTALARLQRRLVALEGQNEAHAVELAEKSRSGLPMMTNAQCQARGTGSGYEIIYPRCRCEDTGVECLHNPRTTPNSPADLAAAADAIENAATELSNAETTLAGTDASFDAFAAAREVGARFCWWPLDRGRDPRKHRWQGQPMTPAEMSALGPHALNRGVRVGGIVEVPYS